LTAPSPRRLLVLLALWLGASCAAAQDAGPPRPAAPEPTRTESPQATLESFLRLQDAMEAGIAAYLAAPSFAGAAALALLSDRMLSLIDLQAEPPATRRETGVATVTYLMDIFGRIDPVDPAAAPGIDAVGDAEMTNHRLPDTPLYLVRMEDGPRRGEFLFSGDTVQVAPRFFRAVRALPLRSRLDIESFTALGPQMTGPAVPPALVRAIPAPMKRLWLDTPAWKIATLAVVAVLAILALAALHGALTGGRPRGRRRLGQLTAASLTPLALLAFALALLPWAAFQLNLSGRFSAMVDTVQTVVAHLAYAWLFWLGVRGLFELAILSPRISEKSLDANLLRLVSGVIGVIGVAVILAFGGQAIGLPILSVLAGLGIGGLAVALALRPTLENLVGGVMLYIDRPVRVGDFCSFAGLTGTVENIGVRSTSIRALDRTLISVPNAKFADMEIVNFAHCDQMLIHETLGVRYETTPDQLRFLLAEMRRMLHAHPRIDRDTVRVRFAGYGDSALKIDLRVYAETREWNDFFAIREDVHLRIYDCVVKAGTGFAFPSHTLYVGRDAGLDADRAREAEATVARWRRTGDLPFPRLRGAEIDRIAGSLDYPPRGSADRPDDPAPTAEPLSTADPGEPADPPDPAGPAGPEDPDDNRRRGRAQDDARTA